MDVSLDNEKSPQRFSPQAFLKPPVTQYNYTFRPCLSIFEHIFFGYAAADALHGYVSQNAVNRKARPAIEVSGFGGG
jgi:hypothetical protein